MATGASRPVLTYTYEHHHYACELSRSLLSCESNVNVHSANWLKTLYICLRTCAAWEKAAANFVEIPVGMRASKIWINQAVRAFEHLPVVSPRASAVPLRLLPRCDVCAPLYLCKHQACVRATYRKSSCPRTFFHAVLAQSRMTPPSSPPPVGRGDFALCSCGTCLQRY